MLGARGEYEICRICWWEDDGQDDPHADVFRGGPNHGYTLAQARENFQQFGVMYEPERDRRVTGPDSDVCRVAKQALMAAFDQWRVAGAEERAGILVEIRKQERVLELELKRGIKEYEAQCRRARQSERE
jgi:hypothetical protein